MIFSMRSVTCSVFSTRVPMGVLYMTLNCASSVSGKNSVPIFLRRNMLDTKNARMASNVTRRWPSAHVSARA